jgi:universal stress protein A
MFSPKRILVPTDYSEFSDNALKQALDIAKQHKAKIYLFHVVGLIQQCAVDYCLDNAMLMELDKKSVKSAKDMMQEQIKKVAGSKDVEIVSDVRKGTPYEEILKEEKAKKIDLIVIASHGKTGILSYLMGSVAEKVARGARGQVLIVRGK